MEKYFNNKVDEIFIEFINKLVKEFNLSTDQKKELYNIIIENSEIE
jgi:hypothetical protein